MNKKVLSIIGIVAIIAVVGVAVYFGNSQTQKGALTPPFKNKKVGLQPNLVVTSISALPTSAIDPAISEHYPPVPGSEYKVYSYTIKNIGSAAASPFFAKIQTFLYDSNSDNWRAESCDSSMLEPTPFTYTMPISGAQSTGKDLKPGESITFGTVPVACPTNNPPYLGVAVAIADIYNQITESNESDNSLTKVGN